MDQWSSIKYFRKSFPRCSHFRELCSAFEADFEFILSAYESAQYELFLEPSGQDIAQISLRNLSEIAKRDRFLVEFCLARLVELCSENVRGPHAVRQVMLEVRGVECWDDQAFLDSIPQNAPDVLRPIEPPNSCVWHVAKSVLQRCAHGIRHFCTLCAAFFQIHPWLQKLGSGFSYLILVMLIVAGAAIVAEVVFQFMEDRIIKLVEDIPILSQLLLLMRIIKPWLSWDPPMSSIVSRGSLPAPNGDPSATSKAIYAKSILSRVIEAISSLHTVLAPRGWVLEIFHSTTSTTSVGLPLMPIGNGISKAANSTIYMSLIATNLSIIPALLSHSKKGIMAATDLVRGSKLKFKVQLLEIYDTLEMNMDELVYALRLYNSGVPELVHDFKTRLSTALSSIEEIYSPNYQESPLVQLSFMCGMWWLNVPQAPSEHPYMTAMCGVSFIASATAAFCVAHPELRTENSLCSMCLAYTSWPLMPEIENAIQRRKNAVRNLQSFLRMLEWRLTDLYDIAETGVELCIATQDNFRSINAIKHENEADVSRSLAMLENEVKNRGFHHFLDSIFYKGRTAEASQRASVDLNIELRHLKEVNSFHAIAFESFQQAKRELEHWKIDVHKIREDLRRLEGLSDREDWRTMWDNWLDWQQLKYSFENLRPLVKILEGANKRQAVKRRQDKLLLQELSEKCYAQGRESILKGEKVTPWEDCFYGGLQFEL